MLHHITSAFAERYQRIGKPLRNILHSVLVNYSSNQTIGCQFEQHARARPNRPFLYYRDQTFTYAEANLLINKHADVYKNLGVQKNDVVALMMENRPEFLFHFFGLNKIGAVASLINTNSSSVALVHALSLCKPKHIIVGSEVWDSFQQIPKDSFDAYKESTHVDIDPENKAQVSLPIWNDRVELADERDPEQTTQHTLQDRCALIFTSGTTGMPKAAIIKNHRYYRAGMLWGALAFRLAPSDVLYNPLPLYHSNAIMLALGAVVTVGAAFALTRKFSASNFWSDIRKYNATSFIYIGELCRYLMNNPPSSQDKNNRIRSISGNGLTSDIWQPFKERFGISHIAEFYASTEGNAVTINLLGYPGTVGFMLPSMALVKWDNEKQEFIKDRDGFLIRCKPGEMGVLLSKIPTKNNPILSLVGIKFDGYLDRVASQNKVVTDAFEKGDAWFNTGDALQRDRMRRLYFLDRIGDTFRWKGENVSTQQVQEQLLRWEPIREASVYGVRVSHASGRAGMTSIVMNHGNEFDCRNFKSHVDAMLPKYARPIFVRISETIASTETLKQKKVLLQKEGYDPDIVTDPLYFRHPERDEYIPMTQEHYRQILNNKLAF